MSKNMIKKAILVISLIVLYSISKFTYQQFADEGIEYVIGISHSNLSEPWTVGLNEDLREEASKHDNIKLIFYDAARSDKKQREDIVKLNAQKIDLLIVTPNDIGRIPDIVKEVYDSGIPVIILGNSMDISYYTTIIHSNNKNIGKKAGEYVKQLLGSDGGRILEVQGNPTLRNYFERKQGFREAIKNSPEIKIEYVVVAYGSRDKAEERVKEILEEDSNIDMIFAHDDEMAIGAWYGAISNSLRIKVIGINGLEGRTSGQQSVADGRIYATFQYPTGGKEAILCALKILEGEIVPKNIELPTRIITKETTKLYK
jgi:galactofuranose transport system substrate-binding protein